MPIDFHRAPRVEPEFAPQRLPLPTPPGPAARERFPAVAMAAPLVVGLAMLAVTQSPLTVAFVALSPLLAIGSWLDQLVRGRRSRRTAATAFATSLELARSRIDAAQAEERAARLAADPGAAIVAERMLGHATELWSRRPGDGSFLRLRLGLGRRPSLVTAIPPPGSDGAPEHRARVEATAAALAEVDGIPIVERLSDAGAIGVAGWGESARAAMRALVVQLVGLHAPSELRLAAFVDDGDAADWAWLAPLPHLEVGSAGTTALADSVESRERLLRRLEAMAGERASPVVERSAFVVLVLGTRVDRARLVSVAERGPDAGIRMLWLTRDVAGLPAICRTYLELGETGPIVGRVDAHERIPLAVAERMPHQQAAAAACAIAELVDADAPSPAVPDPLPATVPFDTIEPGLPLDSPTAVAERWRTNATRPALHARLGATATGTLTIDLRADGPHALVGGTTGSGKSELLQSWILSLATNHAPDRVTFLLIDYKGGAAFAECAALPHTVGLVTDLTPQLARRALRSLRAELAHRERLLAAKSAKDLVSLEHRGDPEAPPALVIVIDEFAALAGELPEFVDGIVDVAQRGRSLGLHLIMATQRPAGVIRDSLRANMSLRIALRLADAADSTDVVGTADAAGLRAETPGRALLRVGTAAPLPFQTAHLGSGDRSGVDAAVALVATIRAAAMRSGGPPPRRPWLPELPPLVPIRMLPASAGLAIGLADLPDAQQQTALAFDPDRDAHLLAIGRSGSGKSTVLRTVAAAAAASTLAGEPVQIYAIDAGNGGLAPIAALPIVGEVAPLRDEERVRRTFATLIEELDRRAAHAADHDPGTEDAARVGTALPRMLLLIDGLGALREGREHRIDDPVLPALVRLLALGRGLRMHVVATAERPGAVPSAMLGEFGLRLVLRPGAAADAAMLGVDPASLAEAPPGRCLAGGTETQLAVPGRTADAAEEASRFMRLARRLRRAGVATTPRIPVLEDRIPLERLPPRIARRPALGLTAERLAAIGFPDRGIVVVAGRRRSGRSTAIRTMLVSLRRAGRIDEPIVVGPDAWPAPPRLVPPKHSASGRPATTSGSAAILVVEQAHDLAGSPAEAEIAAAIRAVRDGGGLAIVELDPALISTAWQLQAELKRADAGLFLRAEEQDALGLFHVPLGRAPRTRTPPGRAWLIEDGVAIELQIAIADTDPAEAGTAVPPPRIAPGRRDSPRTRQSPVTLAASPP